MSSAAVTYSFTNATTADATQVNQNFSDLVGFINGSLPHSDGSGGAADIRGLVAGQVGDQSKKFHLGTDTGNCDSSGYRTVTHGAGFTPTLVICVWTGNSLGGGPGGVVGTDSYTSTQFRYRNALAGAATNMVVTYLCIS